MIKIYLIKQKILIKIKIKKNNNKIHSLKISESIFFKNNFNKKLKKKTIKEK